ncbi:hypothetical protein HYV71_02690 [Candidatus Uhrbacteria bacterium]|nr:hypothetical protein [Candidatus Uhrbacteria bacterium]
MREEQERPNIVSIERGIILRLQRGIQRTLKEMKELEDLMKENSEQLRIALKLNRQGIKNDDTIELLLDDLQQTDDSWNMLKEHVEQGMAILKEQEEMIEAFFKEKKDEDSSTE